MDDVNEVLTIGQIRKFKVAELREKLQKLNQPTTGLKPELVNRLFNALFDAQKKADAERLNLLHDPAASFGDTLTPNEQKTSSEQNDKPIVEDDINKNRGEESLTSEGGEGAADNSSTEEENSQDIEMPALIEEDTKVIQSETLTNVRQLQQAENIGQVTNEGRNDGENHNLANESKVEMLPHAANDAAEQSSVNSVDVQKPPGEFQASAEVKSVSNEPLVPTDDISAVSPKTIEKTSHTDEIQNMAENVSVEDAESSQKIQKTAENVSVEIAESSQTRAKVEVSSVEEQQKLEPEGVPVTIAKENDIAVDSSASDVLPAPVVPENVHCNSEELKAPVQESTEDDAKTKIESTSSKIDEPLDVKTDPIVTKAKNEISTLSGSTDTIAESEQSAVNAKDGKKDGTEPQAKEAKAVKPSTIEESSEKTGIKIQPKERKRRWGSSSLAAPSNSTVPIASKGISSDALKELIPDLNKTNTQVSNKTDDTKHKKTTSIRPTIQISTNVSGIAHSNSENSGPMGTPVTPDSRQAPHKLVEIQESGTSKKADSIDGKEVNTEILKPISSSTASGNKSDRVSVDCSKETPSVSPPQNPESNIIFIRNLVRPFTLLQLKEVLGKKGTLVEEKFWIDKIKSKCYVAYETQEQAVAARASLHGLRWPDANPKTLIVDYATEEELSYHLNLEKPALPAPEKPATEEKRPSKDKYDVVVRRDKVDERETSKKVDESQEVRKEKRDDVKGEKRPIREWDREKFLHSKEDQPSSIKRKRSLSPRKESETRNNEKDRPSRDSRGPDKGKKEKEIEQESPANLLDGLFKKTKATPCIYWLPLTEEQAKKRGEDRVEIEKKRNEERLAREAERRTRMGEMGRGRRFSPAYARRDSSPGRGPIRGRNNYQQRRGPPPPRFRGRRGRSASASGKDSRSRSRSLSRSRSRSRKRSASRSLSRSRSPARRTGPKRSRTRSRSRSLRRSPRRR